MSNWIGVDDEGGESSQHVEQIKGTPFFLTDCVMIPTVDAQRKRRHHTPGKEKGGRGGEREWEGKWEGRSR